MLPLSLSARRFLVLAVAAALFASLVPTIAAPRAGAATGDPVLINECRYEQHGTDDGEFVELVGTGRDRS